MAALQVNVAKDCFFSINVFKSPNVKFPYRTGADKGDLYLPTPMKKQLIFKNLSRFLRTSVAEPDPGSGAFLTPGSGIRDPGWEKSQDLD